MAVNRAGGVRAEPEDSGGDFDQRTLVVTTMGEDTLGLQVEALPGWLGGSIALAVTVAVLGSFLPAWLASRFDPSANMQEV